MTRSLDETFEIDTELTRDAIYAGIWTRLCSETRGSEDGHHLHEYIEHFAVSRGEPTELLGWFDEDIGWFTDARRRLREVQATPLGSMVDLDDVRRFMPHGWHEEANRWLWAPSEIREVEDEGGHVVKVREFGTDEQLRGDR